MCICEKVKAYIEGDELGNEKRVLVKSQREDASMELLALWKCLEGDTGQEERGHGVEDMSSSRNMVLEEREGFEGIG